ncbi:hypothetical protein ACEPAF_5979 [Sanghuangporus sanghuang]
MSKVFLHLSTLIGLALGLLATGVQAANPTACIALATTALATTDFSSLNTTILNATYYDSPTTVTTLGTCSTQATVNASLCRIQYVVNTSDISAIAGEAWLPDDWNQRFVALGNGGLNGCIDYDNLNTGSSKGFAAIASNNGHDGDTGEFFANNTEVLADFTSRAIHTETLVGKQFVSTYYGQSQNSSYYVGCSTGGRQGFYAALHHPEDFDGILAGSPATNFNHLIGWSAMLSRFIGAPGNASASFISSDLWDVTSQEILNQCDGLDGVVDGVITEPEDCQFRPEELLCSSSSNRTDSCLTVEQVETLRLIYAPLYGNNNTLLYSRFEPGAESSAAAEEIFDGEPFDYADDWMRYVVANDVNYDYSQFWIDDIYEMDALDPGNISTWNGDLSAFRERGGKLISYHGRADPLISALNSKRLYDLTAKTLGESNLDDFYRLFLIPGMGHCSGGTGAVNFGQPGSSASQPQVGSTDGTTNVAARHIKRADQATDIWDDLINWVEGDVAPDTITGVSTDGTIFRTHCRYPQRSVWDGSEYTCVSIDGSS